MKLTETMELTYPRKLVEHIILGLEDPLNQHLIRLIGFDFPPEQQRHLRRELRTWLDKLQRLRIKPDRRTESFKFYYDLLFDYPFGGVEVQNMRIMTEFISKEYDGIGPTKYLEEIVGWLKAFHATLAQRLHNGEAVLDMVPE
jgi:hypothetical protein